MGELILMNLCRPALGVQVILRHSVDICKTHLTGLLVVTIRSVLHLGKTQPSGSKQTIQLKQSNCKKPKQSVKMSGHLSRHVTCLSKQFHILGTDVFWSPIHAYKMQARCKSATDSERTQCAII